MPYTINSANSTPLVLNPQEELSPPALPPKTLHKGWTVEQQAPQSRPPALLPRPPALLPRPDDSLLDNIPLRQHHTAPDSLRRNAMYEMPSPPSRPAPVPPSRMHEFMTPPSFHAPSLPVSQERSRMPLPGEGFQPSLAKRKGVSPLVPLHKATTTGDTFAQLNAKSEQQFVRGDYIDKGNPQYFGNFNDYEVKHQRFGDINTCKATQLFTSKGVGLPANQMKVDGKNVAMRSQYPRTEKLGSHLSMLADQKPAVLVILSSDADLKTRHLPAYFREDKHYNDAQYDENNADKYDDVSVRCNIDAKSPVKMAGDLNVQNYTIQITVNGKTTPISVMHVNNWEDRTTIDINTLKTLVSDINQKIDRQIKADSSYSPQPFIHCSAGVGRTSVVAIAIELLEPGNVNTPLDIALQLRKTGCSRMVQTEAQFDTLVELYDNIKSGS